MVSTCELILEKKSSHEHIYKNESSHEELKHEKKLSLAHTCILKASSLHL